MSDQEVTRWQCCNIVIVQLKTIIESATLQCTYHYVIFEMDLWLGCMLLCRHLVFLSHSLMRNTDHAGVIHKSSFKENS